MRINAARGTWIDRVVAAMVVAGALLAGGATAALAASVAMVDDEFSPASITVGAGEAITFSNQGDRPHTATADDGSFDTGSVDPGASATVTITEPGTYGYYCEFHGGPGGEGMAGTITVTAGGGPGGGNGGGGPGGGAGGGADRDGAGDAAGGARLPQTATPLPLIALLGAGLLGGGLWLGRRRDDR